MTAVAGGSPDAGMAPSLWRRMAAFVYEGLLLFGIGLIPGALGALLLALNHGQPLPHGDTLLRVVTLLIYALYFTGFWSGRGQTLAMQTWNLRLVTVSGEKLTRGHALLRFIASCAWFAPATLLAALNGWNRWQAVGALAVGVVAYALFALLHPQRQFWHDALCGTRLVEVEPQVVPLL